MTHCSPRMYKHGDRAAGEQRDLLNECLSYPSLLVLGHIERELAEAINPDDFNGIPTSLELQLLQDHYDSDFVIIFRPDFCELIFQQKQKGT